MATDRCYLQRGAVMPVITCTVCGKREEYDKGMDAQKYVCYSCRNKHSKRTEPSANGFFCISTNKDGKQLQTCWLCDNQKATHLVEFNYIHKERGFSEAETDKYFFYCCDKCFKEYSKLDGKTFDVTKEINFVNYREEVQLKYLLQKKEMK